MNSLESPEADYQPKIGETYLACSHFSRPYITTHWIYYDPPLRTIVFNHTEKVRFLCVCGECLNAALDDPLKMATARGTWKSTDNPIRKADPPKGYGGMGEYAPSGFVVPRAIEAPKRADGTTPHVPYSESRYCSPEFRKRPIVP